MEKTIVVFTENYFFMFNGKLLVCFSGNCPDIDINPEEFIKECNSKRADKSINTPNMNIFGTYVPDSQFHIKGKFRYSKAFEELERWKSNSKHYINTHTRYSYN